METFKENTNITPSNNEKTKISPEELKDNFDCKKLLNLTKNANNYDSLEDLLDNNKFLKNCSDKSYIKAYNESNDNDKYVIKQLYYLNNDINEKSFNELIQPKTIDGLNEISINLFPGEFFIIERGNNQNVIFFNKTNKEYDFNLKVSDLSDLIVNKNIDPQTHKSVCYQIFEENTNVMIYDPRLNDIGASCVKSVPVSDENSYVVEKKRKKIFGNK